MRLVIGIGNSLRGDDGAGPAVVERLTPGKGCTFKCVHQLLPEHAEELAKVRQVVFVDAAVDVDEMEFNPLYSGSRLPAFGHVGDPGWLLDLAECVYGRAPEAYLLAIPAHDFAFKEGFSEATATAVEQAITQLDEWLSKSAAAVPPQAAG